MSGSLKNEKKRDRELDDSPPLDRSESTSSNTSYGKRRRLAENGNDAQSGKMNASEMQAGPSSPSENKNFACLGYFEDNNQNEADACVLVVSYEFKDDAEMRRHGNEVDLANLRKSFEEKRKCRYKELASPKAEDLLGKLQKEKELFKFFNILTVPSAFFLIILSHGEENNIILTDHKNQDGKYISFLTTQVVEAIKVSPNLREQLNVIFFGPCRGNLKDGIHQEMEKPEDYKNQTSSRLTNMPGAENFVIVYSTVETTSSNRDTTKGTWLVQGICTLLDHLDKNEPLEVFLTKLQHSIRGKLGGVGQTPEVKYTPHRKFVICKAANQEIIEMSQTDGKANMMYVIPPERSAFFRWCTENGTHVREKWAVIFGARASDPNVERTEKALHENLGFKTYIFENTIGNLNFVYEKTQGEQGNVGCFLAVFFAPLTLDKETNEICVRVGKTGVKIGDLVYKFLGPGNKMWIGRPKLFFFVHQTIDSDCISEDQKLTLNDTNHSECFVCVLKNSAEQLIQLFENPQLKNGTPIQELALDLIRKDTNKAGLGLRGQPGYIDNLNEGNMSNRDVANQACTGLPRTGLNTKISSDDIPQIVSTLPFLVDFFQNNFVAPRLTVVSNKISKTDEEEEYHNKVRRSSIAMGRSQEANVKNVKFDELKYEMKQQLLGPGKQDYCVWLFSSLPGSGKSTIIREIKSYLNREKSEKIVFTVELQQLYEYFSEDPILNIVTVLSHADKMSHDLQTIVEEKRAIVFLDGFDEICPLYRKQVLGLIKTCTQMQMPLVIATRPEEEETILKSLKGFSTKKIEIKPLDSEEQGELLMKLGKTKHECEEIFKLFEKSGTSEILTNPLHLSLTCQIDSASIGGIFGIYKQVIEKKVKEALGTKIESILEPPPSKIKERFRLLMDQAVRSLVENESSISQPTEADIKLINNTGVASILENNAIRFVHQTFAEFLLALRFIQEIERDSKSEIPIFQNVNLRQSRVFIDSYLSQQNVPFRNKLKTFFNQCQNFDIHRFLREQLNRILHELMPTFQFLLNRCNVNNQDENKDSLLILAAQFSSEEMCKLFVEKGADVSAVDKDGDNALHCACTGGKLENVKYLTGLNGFSLKKKNQLGRTALHCAAEKGHVTVAEFLLSKGAKVNSRDKINRTPLILAAQFSSEEMCRLLVANGAYVKAVDKDGDNALHHACTGGKLENVKYLMGLNRFIVEKKGCFGETALHFAVWKGHVAVAEFLLSKGANVDALDDDNGSPLTLAAQFSSEEMCRLLVDKGADLSAVDKDGDDALHLACLRGKLENAKYLLGLSGFSVEKKGFNGGTALHCAAEKGHVALAEFLLSKGADVEVCDDDNNTPLTLAAQLASKEMFHLFENGVR